MQTYKQPQTQPQPQPLTHTQTQTDTAKQTQTQTHTHTYIFTRRARFFPKSERAAPSTPSPGVTPSRAASSRASAGCGLSSAAAS